MAIGTTGYGYGGKGIFIEKQQDITSHLSTGFDYWEGWNGPDFGRGGIKCVFKEKR